MTRLQALEAVAEAARSALYVSPGAIVRLADALDALDALPADPAPAEKVGAKTVQITAIPAGDGLVACVFALRDDGSIWGKGIGGGNWWRESDIPTDEASCLPLVKERGE